MHSVHQFVFPVGAEQKNTLTLSPYTHHLFCHTLIQPFTHPFILSFTLSPVHPFTGVVVLSEAQQQEQQC